MLFNKDNVREQKQGGEKRKKERLSQGIKKHKKGTKEKCV